MNKELPKQYNAKEYEDSIYEKWEASGFFNPDNCPNIDKDKKPFSMVLPPPNVTGVLHMGHASMLAIEDTLVRFARMQGRRTLWLPGTDHAAIATEAKVEKLLIDSGIAKPKEKFGREDFLQKVRDFAKESHDTIIYQTKKMGSSLDWSREAYTLDEVRNKLVNLVFKKMYDDGLIYRGYRVVNWSVRGQSTCSDDELEYSEQAGKLYTFKYDRNFPINIATTRPETKLGDTAVAVHPEGRWKKHIGKVYTAKNVGGSGVDLEIKIISSDEVDDAYGTGALGVTPAHSLVDFDMFSAERARGNDINLIQVIDENGKMMPIVGESYAGLSVEEARGKFVSYLKEAKLLEKEEDIIQNVGRSDRFKDIIEPLPKTQWFIDVNKRFTLLKSELTGVEDGDDVTLKQLMQKVVDTSQIKILPARFEKVYFNWINNLRDWNISRQIWFGHRIPVWYCLGLHPEDQSTNECNGLYVGEVPPKCAMCGASNFEQDSDTLDTWFSAGMWTFSTLLDHNLREGESLSDWLDRSADFNNYHPTQLLETGYDIIFFWVARMILMTTYTLGQIPFPTVYLHGLVRDENGKKMSKTLGNVMDPLDMIDVYGTDATRLSLIMGSSPGNDIKFSKEKVEGYRNFTTKLWNICRFMSMSIAVPNPAPDLPKVNTLADKWIFRELDRVIREVTERLERYELSLAGEILRDFTWNQLADWYLEIAKVEGGKSDVLNYILVKILKLWHPFMPFVTEALWQEIYDDGLLLVKSWPNESAPYEPVIEFSLIIDYVSQVRSLRAEYKIEPAKKIVVYELGDNNVTRDNRDIIKSLARIEELYYDKVEGNLPNFTLGNLTVYLDVAGAVDVDMEIERLNREIEHTSPYVTQMEKKLNNSEFVDNAPANVVMKEREKYEDAKVKLQNLQNQLMKLRK